MDQTREALLGLVAGAAEGVDVTVVADGLSDRTLQPLRAALDEVSSGGRIEVELIRTSAVLGHASAVNIGIRRARASVVLVLDPSIVPKADVITPLVEALADPGVAIAGPFGLRSSDLRRFEEVEPDDAASADGRSAVIAIQGYLMAFRRSDAIQRGPLDEAFRFYRNLDIWWSLVLRDEGEDPSARRAALVAGLPLSRGEPHAWTATPPAERDRLSKRNFYRVLDRFRTREDLVG
jgi:GT2 family glycosyltransferase